MVVGGGGGQAPERLCVRIGASGGRGVWGVGSRFWPLVADDLTFSEVCSFAFFWKELGETFGIPFSLESWGKDIWSCGDSL